MTRRYVGQFQTFLTGLSLWSLSKTEQAANAKGEPTVRRNLCGLRAMESDLLCGNVNDPDRG